MGSPLHLARRFFGSLRPGGPPRPTVSWVHDQLLPAERALWDRMSGPDRRHSAGVARRVASALGDGAPRPVLAAALLHDVGKTDSGLRTGGRVLATLLAGVRGRARAASGQSRTARYLRHDVVGAELLERAGSDPLTVAWTREHHLPRERWTVPLDVADALERADDD
jgi:putative nucleotidyltransferase with HDIG domain